MEGNAGLEINIRMVGIDDQLEIIKLFQAFDRDKYKAVRTKKSSILQNKSSKFSLAGLRIDERGGMYLNPLLDTNSAYFRCYVADIPKANELAGYALMFNTIDDDTSNRSLVEEPLAVIEDLYVKPKYRRLGIGSQLVKKAVMAASERGCASCEVIILQKKPEELRFWEHNVGKERLKTVEEGFIRMKCEDFLEAFQGASSL